MSAALNESGEVFIWGCAGCLKPTKQAFDQQFSEIKVGGSFIVLADDNGHLLQTDGIQKPKYIEGVNEKISLQGGISVGHNFAFVIGQAASE